MIEVIEPQILGIYCDGSHIWFLKVVFIIEKVIVPVEK